MALLDYHENQNVGILGLLKLQGLGSYDRFLVSSHDHAICM